MLGVCLPAHVLRLQHAFCFSCRNQLMEVHGLKTESYSFTAMIDRLLNALTCCIYHGQTLS